VGIAVGIAVGVNLIGECQVRDTMKIPENHGGAPILLPPPS